MPRPPIARHSRLAPPEIGRAHLDIRRRLLDRVLEICARDDLSARDLADMCRTSRPRMHNLLAGRAELFNSETLVDILWRLGADVDVEVTGRHPYRRFVFANPRPGWKPWPGARE